MRHAQSVTSPGHRDSKLDVQSFRFLGLPLRHEIATPRLPVGKQKLTTEDLCAKLFGVAS